MKKLIILSILAVSCAVAPRITNPPPKFVQLNCAEFSVADEAVVGLVCEKASVMRFSEFITLSEHWKENAWKVCGPEKTNTGKVEQVETKDMGE